MEESWRMRMGIPTVTPPEHHFPTYLPRRSAEDTSSHCRKHVSDDSMDPEDFSDVFGGPPRTIISGRFSTCSFPKPFSSANFFYEEIFQPPKKAAPAWKRNGRSLPEFRIPGHERSNYSQYRRDKDRFYRDIFGFQDDQSVLRSRSRSKASSSSVLSSEELSPLRTAVSAEDGDDISSLASKLRPLNVRWSSVRMGYEDHLSQHNRGNQQIFHGENENMKGYPFGLSTRNASPETISLEPISNSSFRVSADDQELNSPSSAVCQSDREQKVGDMEDYILVQDIGEDDDDAVNSYVIEIISDNREGTREANGVDEAIAWAREKSQTPSPMLQGCEKEKPIEEMSKEHQFSEGHTDSFESLDERQEKWAAEEEMPQFESMVLSEMQILDEKIRLWSTGNEVDIRLLLSSLHHILWPNSGWVAIPLMNLIGSSQVKKAYQKAQLCLHPDKLQQRGATLAQKYVANKAFSVLQDAWASFITQDDS